MRGSTARTPAPFDEAAFIRLYDKVGDTAYGLALRMIGDPQRAEDVTREAFLEVWRTCHRYDPAQGGAVGWVLGIVHRRAADCLRGRSTARAPRDTDTSSTDFSSTDFSDDALKSLTPPQRQAVELAYFDGHTCADVARLMQAPLDSTRTLLHTALARLGGQGGTPIAETA